MPPNLHGTDIILTNYMIGNDPSFFIFVSDEFRKIKDAEVKGLLEVSTGITKETVSGKGDNNTFSIQKDEHFVVYPSGSLHGKNLGWNGNNRSTSTTHNISSGNGAHKDDKVEGLDLENATMVEESAETTRRPTATAKPRVNPKKSAVESWYLTVNNLWISGKFGLGQNQDFAWCTNGHGNGSRSQAAKETDLRKFVSQWN